MMSKHNALRGQSGFTLIEMMMVVGIVGVLASMAVLQVSASRPSMIGDGGMRMITAELNSARETAISQRRQMEVTFVGNNTIRITRRNIPNGTTIMREVPFESGLTFAVLDGTPDTPDAFGNGNATIAPTIMFTTDGSLINNAGAPVNGSVFFLVPGMPQSFRGITILGATGRVRAYRWTGTKWTRA